MKGTFAGYGTTGQHTFINGYVDGGGCSLAIPKGTPVAIVGAGWVIDSSQRLEQKLRVPVVAPLIGHLIGQAYLDDCAYIGVVPETTSVATKLSATADAEGLFTYLHDSLCDVVLDGLVQVLVYNSEAGTIVTGLGDCIFFDSRTTPANVIIGYTHATDTWKAAVSDEARQLGIIYEAFSQETHTTDLIWCFIDQFPRRAYLDMSR